MNQAAPSDAPVAFVSNSAWYIYIHRIDVIRHLMQLGYRILIVAPPDRVPGELKDPRITYLPLQYSNKSKSITDSIQLFRSLRKIYSTHRPACVFHYAIKANIFGNFAARQAGIPCVSVIIGIGYSFLRKNWLNLLVRRLYKAALRVPREVWFMNNEDGAFFLKQRLVDIDKVHILHGEGVNTQYFSRQACKDFPAATGGVFTFITTTRLLYSKGIGTAVDAIRILRNQGYNLRYRVAAVPDTDHPDSIPETVLQNWVHEGVIEVEPFTEDVRPLLLESHCFLLPTYYNEGLPRCLMEAASMELPVITTRQKGCSEAVVDGETGFFCQMRDPVDLAARMEAMMTLTAADRRAMGAAGRRLMIRKFSIERIVKEYERVLRGLQPPGGSQATPSWQAKTNPAESS